MLEEDAVEVCPLSLSTLAAARKLEAAAKEATAAQRVEARLSAAGAPERAAWVGADGSGRRQSVSRTAACPTAATVVAGRHPSMGLPVRVSAPISSKV